MVFLGESDLQRENQYGWLTYPKTYLGMWVVSNVNKNNTFMALQVKICKIYF